MSIISGVGFCLLFWVKGFRGDTIVCVIGVVQRMVSKSGFMSIVILSLETDKTTDEREMKYLHLYGLLINTVV